MPREADFYTPSEVANMLGLAEFTVLGLLTSGQLEGHQDDQGRWWIPAAAVEEAVRRDRATDPLADPSAEETIVMEAVSPGDRGSADTTTQSAPPEAGVNRGGSAADAAEIPDESGWVTTEVAAEALRVSPRTVRDYIRSGDLNAKSEGEGVAKRWLVSIDAVQALRDKRLSSGEMPRARRATAVGDVIAAANAVDIGELVAALRELEHRLGRAEARAELTERTESSLREDLERVREERARHQEEVERLRAELEAERSKGFWRRLFGV